METNIEEIWKDIPTYNGRYQASDLGRFRSVSRLRTLYMRVTPKGKYLVIGLYKKGILKTWYAHRLTVYTFTGVLPDSVDHINNIKTDNRLINLESVSQRENVHRYLRGYGHGTCQLEFV